jgi:hypothetical protein
MSIFMLKERLKFRISFPEPFEDGPSVEDKRDGIEVMGLCVYMKAAEEAWKKLLRWISLCRLPEMIQAGKMVRNYLWGILNTIRLGATNGPLEVTNGCIQRIKRMAYGSRNKERFKTVIIFHLGNLNMDPSTI